MARGKKRNTDDSTQSYDHKDAESLLRPDVGLQAQFKEKRPPKTYRYDPSIDPELSWDISADQEKAEALIAEIDVLTGKLSGSKDPAEQESLLAQIRSATNTLKSMSQPFLNWAGKTERTEFNVPTLPLFIHERLSTQAILETLKRRKKDKATQLKLFADEDLPITDRILKAYIHKTPWVNRMILGDSLVVMNSLLEYEGLGGQVQMIYIDPPYGVKFGSNFQPFIRKRDVKHGDDKHMTREPEMVQAYRDTWELGLHSYLTYLRDRFLLVRELLHPSGSIFVQIGDENVHHVREVLEEVFEGGPMSSDYRSYVGKAREIWVMERIYAVVDSIGTCKFHTIFFSPHMPSWNEWSEMIYYITGMKLTSEEIKEIGERIYTVERMFNHREAGFDRKDDRLPERYFAEAVPGGLPIIKGTKMDKKKWEKMLDEYYEFHGWDKNGLPTKGGLKKLGLDKEPSHIL